MSKMNKTKYKQSEKNRKLKKGKEKYAVCAAGLFLAIMASLFLPQAFFSVQDYYQMKNTSWEKRQSAGTVMLDLSYEKDLCTRMTAFAEGLEQGRNYCVASTEYGLEEIDPSLFEDFNAGFWERGILQLFLVYDIIVENEYYWIVSTQWLEDDSCEISCKRYVIYDEEYTGGIAISCLYIDLALNEDLRLRFLMDTEDGTVYYLKLFRTQEGNLLQEHASLFMREVEENNWVYEEAIYYETDLSNYTEYYEKNGILPVEMYEVQVHDARSFDAAENDYEGEEWNVKFSYSDYPLTWQLSAQQLEDDDTEGINKEVTQNFVFSLGIKEIGRLIPELEEP